MGFVHYKTFFLSNSSNNLIRDYPPRKQSWDYRFTVRFFFILLSVFPAPAETCGDIRCAHYLGIVFWNDIQKGIVIQHETALEQRTVWSKLAAEGTQLKLKCVNNSLEMIGREDEREDILHPLNIFLRPSKMMLDLRSQIEAQQRLNVNIVLVLL